MAEVVGLAASIIAIIQVTANVASLSYHYIGDFKKAPENIRRFIDELKSFTAALSTLQIGIKDDTSESSIALQAQIDGPLQKCMIEMKRLENKLNSKPKKGMGRWKNSIVRAQWPFEEKETLVFIEKIERYKSLFVLLLGTSQLYHTTVIEKAVHDIKTDVQALAAEVAVLHVTTRTPITSPPAQQSSHNSSLPQLDVKKHEFIGKCTQVLYKLHPGSFDKRHVEISRRRKTDTGEWILSTPEVKGWSSDENGSARLLWGFGIPGAGKTFLSSLLIDHLQGQSKDKNYGIAYIYFNYKEQERQSPGDVLATLIKQLACRLPQSELPAELGDLYACLVREQKTSTPENLYPVLLAIVKMFTKTFIICDALDECDPQTQRRELLPLFHRMSKDMNLFITSREYPEDIQHSFRDSVKIRLSAKDEDIARYIEQKIADDPRAQRLVGEEINCRKRIIASLQDCSKGMFLLVHFHIEYLCKQTTRRQILEELERLESSSDESEINPMDPTYNRAMEILRAQPKNCVDLAFKVLSWLVRSRRVLSVRELQLAVSTNRTVFDELDLPDRKTVLDVCSSLVTIDEKEDTVRLVHYTAQEYILRNSLLPNDANLSLAMSCITFLSLDIFAHTTCNPNELEFRKQLYPFLDYSASFASYHLANCDEHSMADLVLKFLGSLGNVSSYLQLKYPNDKEDYPRGASVLHAAVSLGNKPAVQVYIAGGIDVKIYRNGRTALMIAADEGHLSVAELLLDRGAEMSAADKNGRTALLLAAHRGHEPIVRLLLDRGAEISAADGFGQTALLWAVNSGHEPVVRLLLDRGAEISATDRVGWTALLWAVNSGHEPVVRLLLDRGAEISATDRVGWTALLLAARSGHEPVVRLLLDRGAEISAADEDGWTALLLAADSGHEPIA